MLEEKLEKEQILKDKFENLLTEISSFNTHLKEFINTRDKFLYSLGDNTKITRNVIEQVVVVFREGSQYKKQLDYISESEIVLKVKKPSGYSEDVGINRIGVEYFWSVGELIDYIKG